MILLEMTGGLGNQMFQYALYRRFLSLGKEVYLDTSYYRSGQVLREFELEQLGLPMEIMPDSEVGRYRGFGYHPSLAERLSYKIKGAQLAIYEDSLDHYQSEIFEIDNVYLRGYWQSEQYFREVSDTIRELYTLHPVLGDAKHADLDLIRSTDKTPVSLHVRLGDYLESQNTHVYAGICTETYYHNSIEYIREHVENPLFVVFSDNMEQASAMIQGEDVYYIHPEDGGTSFVDMYLMSQCQHHIIANSTYSWWGAWLTEQKNTIVVAPERWFAHIENPDVVCDRWTRVPIR